MNDKSPHSRVSRSRRAIALMAWGLLVGTAFLLWNAHQTGTFRSTAYEPVAFLLAAFGAFVGVFAWMLFNPNQRTTAESPLLFFAAAATLFPPPIIGFCLMPIESPLRWWLVLGIFLLVAVALLSHVPDEFFSVPRGRHSYVVPLPAFDRVSHSVMDPNASWFTFNDLSTIVADGDRPSLVPKSYLNREQSRRTAAASAAPARRVVSDVDDILGSDFDIGLLDEAAIDFEDQPSSRSRHTTDNRSPGQARRNTSQATSNRMPPVSSTMVPPMMVPPLPAQHSNQTLYSSTQTAQVRQPRSSAPQYLTHRRESTHLRQRQLERRESQRATPLRYQSRAQRHAASLLLHPRTARTLSDAFGLAANSRGDNTPEMQVAPPKPGTTSARDATRTPHQSTAARAVSSPPPAGSERRSVSNSASSKVPPSQTSPFSVSSSGAAAGTSSPLPPNLQLPPHLQLPPPLPASALGNYSEDTAKPETYRRERPTTARPKSSSPTPAVSTNEARRQSGAADSIDSLLSSRESNIAPTSPVTTALQAGASLFGLPLAYTAANQIAESTKQPDSKSITEQARNIAETARPVFDLPPANERPKAEVRATAEPQARFQQKPESPRTESPQADRSPSTARTSSRYEQPDSATPARNSSGISQTTGQNTTAQRNTEQAPAVQSQAAAESQTSTAARNNDSNRIERTKNADGSEMVEGVMKVRFDKGQKRANLHIPFSPPLPGMPEVECECVDDSTLRLKVPVRQSYGIRIEARRTDADEALEADVGFAAIYNADQA